MTVRRSSSAVARNRCWPRDSSMQGSGARKSFCSYLARIHRSFSSLQEPADRHGHNPGGRGGGGRRRPLCPATSLCGACPGGHQGRGDGGDRCAHQNQEGLQESLPSSVQSDPHLEHHLGPLGMQILRPHPSPAPPPESPEGSIFTSPAGDSDSLRCESQGSGLISFPFHGPGRSALCYPGPAPCRVDATGQRPEPQG